MVTLYTVKLTSEPYFTVLETNSIITALQYYLERDETANDFDIFINDPDFCGDAVHPFDVAIAVWIMWCDIGLDEKALREFIKLSPQLGGINIQHEENEIALMIYRHLMGKDPNQEVYRV